MVFCVRCGFQMGDGAAFCPRCGQGKAAAPTSRPVAAPSPVWAPVPDLRLQALPPNVASSPETLDRSNPQQVVLASFGQRWGAAFLDNLVFWFTLGVGWLIWLWFTSAEGQTPGKKLVGLRVIEQHSGRVASRSLAFWRGVLKVGFDLLALFLFYLPYLVAVGMFFSDPLRRAPWDRAMTTLVVHDPTGKTQLTGQPTPHAAGNYVPASA